MRQHCGVVCRHVLIDVVEAGPDELVSRAELTSRGAGGGEKQLGERPIGTIVSVGVGSILDEDRRDRRGPGGLRAVRETALVWWR